MPCMCHLVYLTEGPKASVVRGEGSRMPFLGTIPIHSCEDYLCFMQTQHNKDASLAYTAYHVPPPSLHSKLSAQQSTEDASFDLLGFRLQEGTHRIRLNVSSSPEVGWRRQGYETRAGTGYGHPRMGGGCSGG